MPPFDTIPGLTFWVLEAGVLLAGIHALWSERRR